MLCWEIWTGQFITDCVYSLFCLFAYFLLLFHPALRIHNFTVLPSHNSTFVNTNDSAYSNFSATVGEISSFFCSAFVRRGWFLYSELTLTFGSRACVVKVVMMMMIIIITCHTLLGKPPSRFVEFIHGRMGPRDPPKPEKFQFCLKETEMVFQRNIWE